MNINMKNLEATKHEPDRFAKACTAVWVLAEDLAEESEGLFTAKDILDQIQESFSVSALAQQQFDKTQEE